MKAKEFNNLTAKFAREELEPLGFKKTGVHYYIYESPNIMVFYKKTFRGSFDGFSLALTHDFISNTKNDQGKLKVPIYLENFPVSISIDTLTKQYSKYSISADFDCDMNFLTREVMTTRKYSNLNPLNFLSYENILSDDTSAEHYIKSSIEILLKEGMRFFKDFSPIISYHALTKYKNINEARILNFKEEIMKYMNENDIDIPKTKVSWWNRWMN